MATSVDLGLNAYDGARMKMDELFVLWLGQKGTGKMIRNLLEAAAAGKPIERPASTGLLAALSSPSSSSSLSPGGSGQLKSPAHGHNLHGYAQPPPRSPSSSKHAGAAWSPKSGGRAGAGGGGRSVERYLSPEKRSSRTPSDEEPQQSGSSGRQGAQAAAAPSPKQRALVPPFYFPGEGGRGRGRALESGAFDNRREDVLEVFNRHPRGISVDDFVPVTKTLCGFPSFFNAVLFRRIVAAFGDGGGGGGGGAAAEDMSLGSGGGDGARITLAQFTAFWREEIEPYDLVERFFRIVKQPDKDFIGRDDFTPFIAELLMYHPGLEFLENHPDFHPKYSATVTARIFYAVNTAGNGRITQRELRRSNLVAMFNVVDEEEDINKVTQFFSYEHFYVLFCRFYELDSDRDNRLSRENLLKYGDHALSSAIVDRIFEVGPRPFEPEADAPPDWRDWMSYQDYVYFMLSEEDRGNERSIRYWFTCVDLDGDGRIGHVEMRYFYDVQMHRMESLGHEVVAYADMVCQIWDMLQVGDRPYVTLEDFLRPDVLKVGGVFFDCLFNLSKFIAFEQRDPFSERQKRADPFDADWDRFAFHDYNRLAAEDEREGTDAEGVDLDAADEWVMDEDRHITVEAPF
ncbi:hypothetical protein JKP88DRAFT_269157 [Tribonema minus]|uniref:EF-hand domain-containing protein n=1 Tax=Tribonema minus TaxID=303371 RepID=A0A835YP70_9STRA|nr:hypothetical protein JKP88DRAFT_269157 [Tribonema minus]